MEFGGFVLKCIIDESGSYKTGRLTTTGHAVSMTTAAAEAAAAAFPAVGAGDSATATAID